MENLGQLKGEGQTLAPQDDPTRHGFPAGDPPPFGWEGGSEYFLDLIIDTLQNLEAPAQGAFLQKFLKSLANINVSESDSITHWQGILRRRAELGERLGRAVSLRTAAVDYFGESPLLRNHILLEYVELKRLRHSAATDPLTGLYNRRFFEEDLARELIRASRYSSPFALLLLDLRSFKRANDTYGHAVGDEILRSVARACVENVRGSDVPCRIGGDEFAILLPEAERPSAEGLAQRIVRKFEEYAKALAPKADLGLDYGVASSPIDGEEAAKLFDAADRSLYANKQIAYQQKEGPEAEPQRPSPKVAGPQEVPIAPETQRPPPFAEAPRPEPVPTRPAGEPPQKLAAAPLRESRRYDRMPIEENRGLAVVRVGSVSKMAKVLDLSFGGVSLLIDELTELPEIFQARLRVPLFPRAEFTLYRVHLRRIAGDKLRIGCSFAPIVKPAGEAPDSPKE